MVRTAAATSSLQAQEIAKKKQIDDAIDTETRNTITKSNLDNGLVTFWEQNEDGKWDQTTFEDTPEGNAYYNLWKGSSDDQKKVIVKTAEKARNDTIALKSSATAEIGRIRNGNITLVRYERTGADQTSIAVPFPTVPKSEYDWDSYSQQLNLKYAGNPEVYNSVLKEMNLKKTVWYREQARDVLGYDVSDKNQKAIDILVDSIQSSSEAWKTNLFVGIGGGSGELKEEFAKSLTAEQQKAIAEMTPKERDTFQSFAKDFAVKVAPEDPGSVQGRTDISPHQQLLNDDNFDVRQWNVPDGYVMMGAYREDGTVDRRAVRQDLVERFTSTGQGWVIK